MKKCWFSIGTEFKFSRILEPSLGFKIQALQRKELYVKKFRKKINILFH